MDFIVYQNIYHIFRFYLLHPKSVDCAMIFLISQIFLLFVHISWYEPGCLIIWDPNMLEYFSVFMQLFSSLIVEFLLLGKLVSVLQTVRIPHELLELNFIVKGCNQKILKGW